MNSIAPLTPNDDRLGAVDEKNNLVYPGVDVFSNPILVRSTMQVYWLEGGKRFVCFPSNVDVSDIEVVSLIGGDGPVATVIFQPELSAHAEYSGVDVEEDGDRDTEDSDLNGVPVDDDDLFSDIEDPLPTDSVLHEMTKAQLLDIAEARGLTLSERLNKQAIIDALTGD